MRKIDIDKNLEYNKEDIKEEYSQIKKIEGRISPNYIIRFSSVFTSTIVYRTKLV
jgi:hypothetical protein